MRDRFDWTSYLTDFSSAAAAGGFSSESLFETSDGTLTAWEKKGDGPLVYLSAGIHGDEPAGPLAVLEMMENGFFSGDHHWLICPALNPGGLARNQRENADGHDLNRDYRVLKTAEISAHAAWLERHPVPEVFVSMHEDWETSGFYFYEINLGEDNPERAEAILLEIAPIFSHEAGEIIDGHEVREPGWIFHCAEADLPESWPEAIFLAKKGCPLSFTFETPSKANLEARTKAHMRGFAALMKSLA
ncbi:MAG: M14 family metallocarboxypeptidase [Armatimonadetes bacterium]|nr:M14 family metallocarboxypeptidase [Akkermansiaceae bacterium]